jgi:hypothetical protein
MTIPVVVVAAAAVIAFAFVVLWLASGRVRDPLKQPRNAIAEFIADVRMECESTCSPLRARWTVGRFEPDVLLGRCECAEPPNIGVGPRVKRLKTKEAAP